MFHSSIVPVAFPISLLVGCIFYAIFHGMGESVIVSIAAAKICLSIANVTIGIPKNALVGDVMSLMFVRPLSLLGSLGLLAAIVGA